MLMPAPLPDFDQSRVVYTVCTRILRTRPPGHALLHAKACGAVLPAAASGHTGASCCWRADAAEFYLYALEAPERLADSFVMWREAFCGWTMHVSTATHNDVHSRAEAAKVS